MPQTLWHHQLASIATKCQKVKTEVVDKLKSLLKEGTEIVNLYNDKFIEEIRKIIAEIEDIGELKGGCGLRYCHKK